MVRSLKEEDDLIQLIRGLILGRIPGVAPAIPPPPLPAGGGHVKPVWGAPPAAAFAYVSDLISAHQAGDASGSPGLPGWTGTSGKTLLDWVPGVGSFFLPLDLRIAFSEYDADCAVSKRVHVPMSFFEVRA